MSIYNSDMTECTSLSEATESFSRNSDTQIRVNTKRLQKVLHWKFELTARNPAGSSAGIKAS